VGDNIKVDLTDIGYEGVEWIHLPQNRFHWQDLVNMNEHSVFIIDREFLY